MIYQVVLINSLIRVLKQFFILISQTTKNFLMLIINNIITKIKKLVYSIIWLLESCFIWDGNKIIYNLKILLIPRIKYN